MTTKLILALFFSATLLPACSRDKGTEVTAPPEAADPVAAAPVAQPPAVTAQPPATVAPAPAPTATAARPATRSTPRTPAAPQPGAPTPAPTIQPSPAPAAVATPPPAPPRKPEFREIRLADGTTLPLVLTATVSSESAAVETPVSARLRHTLSVDGVVVLPEGTVFTGTVTEVERSGRVKGRASLAFVFDRAQIKETALPLRTHAIRFEAEATTGEDTAKIGGGAIGGAIIGGILGGAKGAAQGAAIGGAAGTGVVMMTRGKEVNLTAGTELAATLAAPLTVTVPVR